MSERELNLKTQLDELQAASEFVSSVNVDLQYLLLLRKLLNRGVPSEDRTGVGTRKLVGEQIAVDIKDGFPLLTTKDVWFKGVKEELLWMIDGGRNIARLVRKGVNIWNDWPLKKYLSAQDKIVHSGTPEWNNEMEVFVKRIKEDDDFAEKWGDLGPVYGWQWRHKRGPDGKEVDQLQNAIDDLRNNSSSRRIIVDSWSPTEVSEQALPPCHFAFQFVVTGNRLNCVMTQRSADVFLGLPFNIASYALLTHIIANLVGLEPGRVVITTGDTHLYNNHVDQAMVQLTRYPYPLPGLEIEGKLEKIDGIDAKRIKVSNYKHHARIDAPIAV